METKQRYKEITNYLRNELEITRDHIEKVMEKSIAHAVKQAIAQMMEQTPNDRIMRESIHALATDTRRGEMIGRNLTFKEAEKYGPKEKTWRNWAYQRKIKVIRLGRRYFIPESECVRLMAAGTIPVRER